MYLTAKTLFLNFPVPIGTGGLSSRYYLIFPAIYSLFKKILDFNIERKIRRKKMPCGRKNRFETRKLLLDLNLAQLLTDQGISHDYMQTYS